MPIAALPGTIQSPAAPTPPAGPVYHPPVFDLWSDAGSLAHLGIGFLAGRMSAPSALAIFAIFMGYQIGQTHSGESWPRVGGELVEFGLGMLLSQVR